MYWEQLGTFGKVASVVVTVICFLSVTYVFLWGRVPWLPPKKK